MAQQLRRMYTQLHRFSGFVSLLHVLITSVCMFTRVRDVQTEGRDRVLVCTANLPCGFAVQNRESQFHAWQPL